jgi:glucan phosphoethanolaminetransferase (alkaline phosphatase superfamily)
MPSLSEKLQPFHLALLASLVWVFALGNVVLATELWSATKPQAWKDLAFVVSVGVFAYCGTVLLAAWLCHGLLAKPVLSLVVVLAAGQAYAQQALGQSLSGIALNENLLSELLHSSPNAWLNPQAWMHMAVLAIPPLALIWAAPRPEPGLVHVKSFVLLNSLCLLSMALLLAASPVQYTALLRHHPQLAQHLNPAQPVLLAGQWLGENANRLWQAHAKPLLADVQ